MKITEKLMPVYACDICGTEHVKHNEASSCERGCHVKKAAQSCEHVFVYDLALSYSLYGEDCDPAVERACRKCGLSEIRDCVSWNQRALKVLFEEAKDDV